MTPAEERRDEASRYHKMTLRNLTQLSPFIDWTEYANQRLRYAGLLKEGGLNRKSTEDDVEGAIPPLGDDEPIIVFSPDYLKEVNDLIEEYMKTDEGKITLSNYMVSGREIFDSFFCVIFCYRKLSP